MVEIQTVIQDALGVAGWVLAAYQYWRNEITKRPLIVLEVGKPDRHGIPGRLTVRNRAAHDIFVGNLRLRVPATGGFRHFDGPPFDQHNPKFSFPREISLDWRLNAYGGGEFQSRSCNFIVGPPGASESLLEIECVIANSRDMTASKRRIVRQRIQIEKK